MSALDIEAEPAGLTLATPGDWFAIRRAGPVSDLGILVAEAVEARPELADHQESLDAMVKDLVDAGEFLNVVAGYATIFEVAGGLMPASLVIAVRSMEGMSLERIAAEADQLRDEGLPAPKAEWYDLPAGPTLRIERMGSGHPDADDGREPSTVLLIAQYLIEAPGGQVLMLTFSSPAIALTGRLRALFHQIACTVQFGPAPLEGQEPGR